MQKINAVFGNNTQLSALTSQVRAKELINLFWQSAVPKPLAESSFAYQIDNGLLTVFASNSAVATKIKLTQSSILNALDNSQKTSPDFRLCKVTAINVKVQVKSTPRPRPKRQRRLSVTTAQHLALFAEEIGDSPLSQALKNLASKASR
ncbi:MAG TPA: DUF721 domain-containing protein [Methylophilaceae bacterium]|nr:DUF721 domain-containing protein [Methylophilaceae bacterium]HAJ71735.1 DUF721 domain-containing protein [Methylophilaceae bacterium]